MFEDEMNKKLAKLTVSLFLTVICLIFKYYEYTSFEDSSRDKFVVQNPSTDRSSQQVNAVT